MSGSRENINVSYSDVIQNAQTFNSYGVHVDPYGRYAMLKWQTNFVGSGDNDAVIRVDNDGKDMKLKRVQHSISQGGEDGRAWLSAAERGGSPNAKLVDGTAFMTNVGAGDVSGRGRDHRIVDMPDQLSPKLESQDSHFFRHVGDSDTADECKFYVMLYYVPDDESTSSGTRL